MSNSEAVVTRKFRDGFMVVSAHYMLAELGEIDQAKQAARDDMANAERSYAAMEAEILLQVGVGGINERIRTYIERKKNERILRTESED